MAGSARAAPPASPPPPLSAYGALPAVEQITLSPDGKRVAYIALMGEERLLGVQNVGGGRLATLRVGSVKVRGLAFGDADRLLVTTSTTSKPFIPGWRVPRSEWFQVHSYDLGSGKATTLLTRTPNTMNVVGGSVLPIGDGAVLAPTVTFVPPSGRMDLYRIDLKTGVGKLASQGTGGHDMDWAVTPAGEVVARTRYEDRRGRWLLQARDGDGWRTLDAAGAAVDAPSLLGLGRSDDRVVLATEEDGEQRLVEVSLADGTTSTVLADDQIDGLIHHPKTWRLAGVSLLRDEAELRFFDKQLESLWASVRAAFKGRRVTPETWSDDLSRVVVRVEGPDDPGSYYLVDMAQLKASLIADAYPKIPGEWIAEQRPLRYKAADGLEIPAYLTLPPGRDPKNLPLVVLPHGGPQARDSLAFDWWAQSLASRGYAVLQPNFRGSSGYGLAFVRAGYGEWGRKMQTDLSDGVRHLAAQGLIDPKRVCIMGGSYGGYAALAGAAVDTGVYRCAVSVNGVSDLRQMLAEEARGAGENSRVVRYWSRFMGVERRSDRALDEVSPARRAEAVTIPVLLIHGRDDTVVPYAQSRRMHEALTKAGKSSTLLTLDGEDHWLSRGDTRLRMLEAAVAFVEQHNPAG